MLLVGKKHIHRIRKNQSLIVVGLKVLQKLLYEQSSFLEKFKIIRL